ncbi:MAG: hypothetical protein FWD87_00685 [Spirochaetaceae bacterium]|nr:hypothetical protein [Spirochaetaceae bacterium]
MRKRKKISLLVLLCLYILLFPTKENSVFKILPAWSSDLRIESNIDRNTLIPFRLKEEFGYISPVSGNISYMNEIFYNVTQNNNYYINYSVITDNLIINRRDGSFVANIETEGFPLFIGERLFIISANSKRVSEWDIYGNNLFTFESDAIITSCDANKDTFVAGFVDGTVIIVDKEKRAEKLLKPELSRINVVYGIAISDNSDYIAMITGIDPQYMIIMRKRNNRYNRFFAYQFADNLRHPRYISFFNNNRYLVFESGNTFYCFDFSSRKLNKIELSSPITNIHYISALNFFAVTTEMEEGKTNFTLIDPAGKKLYSKTIFSDYSYIASSENRILFGSNQAIFAVDFIRE